MGTKWEYRTEPVTARTDMDKLLAALGEQGWEMTGVFCQKVNECLLFFKRPKR